MNRDQFDYYIGRLQNACGEIVFLSPTIMGGGVSIERFVSDDKLNGCVLAALALINLPAAITGFYYSISRVFLHKNLKVLNEDELASTNYPLEFVESVVIEDTGGLEHILEKTSNGGKVEWGTFLRMYSEANCAYITQILNTETAKEMELIKNLTNTALLVNSGRVAEFGFNGNHHYHPPELLIGGGSNYSINVVDRVSTLGTLHLLTFNMPNGPEIIGYNAQHVYIPANESKTLLVKATPKEILKYLGK